MQKFKRVMAMGLAATLVLGSCLTAFADETSGSSEGAGANEGHVNKHVISVKLPTVPDESTPFNYTVDPERLVSNVAGAGRYTETFTDEAKTNGVYFLAEEGKYDSSSAELETTSESSAPIKLTVEVAAADDGNIELVDAAPDTTEEADTAQLYLALKLGNNDAVAIKAGETISDEVTINGVDGNFEITWNSTKEEYEYTQKETLSDWNKASFQLTGVASKASAENVSVPTLTVTWKYEDPDAESDDAGYTSVNSVSTTANVISVTLPTGVTVSSLDLVKADGTEFNAFTAGYSVAGNAYTFETTALTNWVGGTITFNYSDGKSDVISIR